MTASVTVSGASDDLIELCGDIYEELSYRTSGVGDLVAFSDGTVLRVTFGSPWRIVPVARGTAELHIKQATEGDEEGTDKATLTGDVRWAVHGTAIARGQA
jgi:hypothetical protein